VATHLILVENTRDWQAAFPDVELITARDYLMKPDQYKTRGLHILNLCRSYRYCSTGYYCSLLAEARRHKVIPSVRTITDLASKAIYSLNVEDLDELIQRVMRKHSSGSDEKAFEANIFFGQSEDRELQELARQIFDLFQAPLLRVGFRRQQRWEIGSLRPVPLRSLTSHQAGFFGDSLNTYLSTRWRTRRSRPQPYYDFAILHNPEEKLPPSNAGALRRFIEAGRKVDADVELITRKDYNRLAEYDALLIRETTAINHHTYRFAKKAVAEGIVVIDDPDSIVKCTNKVYLAELLALNRVPVPRTVILRKGERVDLQAAVGYPAVLKIPDGSFSRGVHKANDASEAEQITTRLFRDSDLILAQEYLYTDFDWRIGVLNNEALFACRYFMSPRHWQIVRHEAGGRATEGGFSGVPLQDVPGPVLKAALAAARLIGNGLYGVDVKERDGRVYVMEVNDNPNVESGVEDAILGAALYRRILEDLVRRIEQGRGG
jgi:glutathione synthase/RimK-type ligase-like ATP-grasp enzyme